LLKVIHPLKKQKLSWRSPVASPKRVLLTAVGSLGDLNPTLALGREFVKHGFEVTVAAGPDDQSRVESENLHFTSVGLSLRELDPVVWERATTRADSTEYIIREILMPNVRLQYDQFLALGEFDLYVSHPLASTLQLVAEKFKRPWVSLALSPFSLFSASDPSLIDALPFGWGKNKPLRPFVMRLALWFASLQLNRWCRPFSDLRKELGLSKAKNILLDGQFSPHGNWILFSDLVQSPQPDWPASSIQFGFPLYRAPGAKLSPETELFLATNPPPVLFTLGSAAINARRGFFDEIIAELNRRGRPAFFAASEPYHLLFPRASVIVHSSGIGTCAEALASGVPQIPVPFANDQPDNAYRVEKLGVGQKLHARDFTFDDFFKALDQVDAPVVRNRGREVAELMKRENFSASFSLALEGLRKNLSL
jgi:rhamnosyltransferase subunit B